MTELFSNIWKTTWDWNYLSLLLAVMKRTRVTLPGIPPKVPQQTLYKDIG